MFYTGICTAPGSRGTSRPVSGREWLFEELPPRTGATALAWLVSPWGDAGHVDYVAFITWNLIRKYGTDWQRLTKERMVQRARTWGFSGLGKWSDQTGDLPLLPVLRAGSVPRLVKHIDPFETGVKDQLVNALKAEMGARVSDPRIVGWSFENEYDGIVPPEEIRTILSMTVPRPAGQGGLDRPGFQYHLRRRPAGYGERLADGRVHADRALRDDERGGSARLGRRDAAAVLHARTPQDDLRGVQDAPTATISISASGLSLDGG